MVFILVGLPGVLVAALLLTTREPARLGRLRATDQSVPFAEVWAFVKGRGMLFFLMFTAYLCLSTQGFSLFSWLVEYYVRNHGWTRTEIGLTYGTIAMVFGIAGSVLAGYWAGVWIARGRPDATLRIVMWGTLLLLPTATAFTLMPDGKLAILVLIPVTFLMAMPPGLVMSTLQAISPNELRGQMVAFYLVAVSFLSYTFAPSLPALISDYVFGSELALGKAISALAVVNYGIAFICLAACLPAYRRALAEAETWYRTAR
jgi:MFS family permease